MTAHRAGSRLAIFAFVAALLLKGAVPLFASAAAHLQGRNVAEICAVYGVVVPGRAGHAHGHDGPPMPAAMMAAMGVAMPGSMAASPHAHHGAIGDAPAPHSPAPTEHGNDHCALGALLAFAATDSGDAAAAPSSLQASGLARPWRLALRPADAAARWAARLGHGPPLFS